MSTVDTWISVEDELPLLTDTVEVKLKNGRIRKAWSGAFTNKWYVSKKGYPYFLWPKENPKNPVVAWREIVTDNK